MLEWGAFGEKKPPLSIFSLLYDSHFFYFSKNGLLVQFFGVIFELVTVFLSIFIFFIIFPVNHLELFGEEG